MSNQHVLKIHPAPLADLLSGAKTAEVRRNDRGFQVGDTVRLMEVNPATGNWTGAADHVRTISHIQTGYGLPDGICVLSYADTALREALAGVEADHEANGLEYGEALILIGQVLDCRSLEDLNAVRRYLNEFMDRYSLRPVPDVDLVQAEQQEARHGHVTPRSDGIVMKCGGPGLRPVCTDEQEAQGAQAGEFQREDRYIVIKRKDLEADHVTDREWFKNALSLLELYLPKREYLVIESDWPEYGPTWAAIQARMTGQGAQVGDERELFNRAYEEICNRPITIREIARRMWMARAALATHPADSIAVNRLRLSLVAWDAELAEQDYQLTADDLRDKLREIHRDIDRLMPEQGQAAVRGAEHE